MADRGSRAEASPEALEAAGQAVARLTELSADLRGCCVLDGAGRVLAASGAEKAWFKAAPRLLEAADRAAGDAVDQVHVGTGDGEAMAVREGGHAMVVVTERFTLASLLAFDMRQALRDMGSTARGDA